MDMEGGYTDLPIIKELSPALRREFDNMVTLSPAPFFPAPRQSRRVRVLNHRRVFGATTGSLCQLWLKSESRK